MKIIESNKIELKLRYTDQLIREIVAFINSEGGKVYIGVDDNGNIVGATNIDGTLRKIADIITTQIEPNAIDIVKPEIIVIDNKPVIVVNINKGIAPIYCIKKYGFSSVGCPVRIGSSCREMSPDQIKIRYEKNFIYNEYLLKRKSSLMNLSFRELKIYFTEKGYHVDDKSFTTNLNFKTSDGSFNLLAELLSDKNNIPLIFVKFKGSNKAAISERSDYGYGCLITSYEKLRNRLLAENINVSDTTVRPRRDTSLFDFDSVNEAVINALVHNDWTISEPQFSMFNDRLEIFSHGGLPNGMSQSQFFEGISKPRNSTLMRIFLTMGLTEHTGHGIPTIINRYGKDVFQLEADYIRCTIPFNTHVLSQIKKINVGLDVGLNVGLNVTEKKVIKLLFENPSYNAGELAEIINITKRTVERTFGSLQQKGFLERIGSKRYGRWMVIK